jgi:hypothetical protein
MLNVTLCSEAALLVSALAVLSGCNVPAVSGSTGGVQLVSHHKLPIHTEESLDDDRYYAFDLNDDGRNEYFAIAYVGAHGATILLLDPNGKYMLGPEPFDPDASDEELDEWAHFRGIGCCDFIVILEDRHEGHRDFISIVEHWAGPKAQEWTLWTYKNGRYESKRVRNESVFSWYHTPHPPFGVKLGVWDQPHPLQIHAYIAI